LKNLFNGIYKGKKVFLTGHTGFKGSWLALWLTNMGAEVYGYSLKPVYSPSHYNLLNLGNQETIGDIRDYSTLRSTIADFKPEIVIHMAAQPLVRLSYKKPLETYEVNVMGTANVLEACRNIDTIKAILVITTDKCYENKEWVWGYRESDPMGGYDPYSSSKGCAELVTSSYRNSFFNIENYGKQHNTLLASVRAGNVIGGGDWSEDRLIPDLIKAAGKNDTVLVRSPDSIRPWQHVLEPLSGYLLLGQRLIEGKTGFADGWNFGPSDESSIPVIDVIKSMQQNWDKINYCIKADAHNLHEANMLKLDCSKAYMKLKWNGIWDMSETIKQTVMWYREYFEKGNIISNMQLSEYTVNAINSNIVWAVN